MKREAKNLRFLQIALIVLVLLAGTIYFFSSYEVQFSPSISVKKTSQSQGTFTPLPSTQKLCGNGKIDPNEDCNSCPQDAQCAFGDSCQEKWGGSIELISVVPEISATIRVTDAKGKSETQEIQVGNTKTILGIKIYLSYADTHNAADIRVSLNGEMRYIYLRKNNPYPFSVSVIYSCLTDCSVSRVVNDGDPYFNEDKQNPNWVWTIKNLNAIYPTTITQPYDLTGPIIGIANNFEARGVGKALEQPKDYINYKGNDFIMPHDFASLRFLSYSPQEGQEYSLPYTPLKIQIKEFDLSQVANVPQEYQPFFTGTKKVLSIESEAVEGLPQPIPVIDPYRLLFVFGSGKYIDDNYQDCINYYYYLRDVKEDKSIDLTFYKSERTLNSDGSCSGESSWSTYLITTIPFEQETTVLGHKLFNYYSQPLQEENKEWAIILELDPDTSQPDLTELSTSNSIILPIESQGNKYLFKAKLNPKTNEYFYAYGEKAYNSNYPLYSYIDLNSYSYDLWGTVSAEENSLEVSLRPYYQENSPDYNTAENTISAKFKIEEGILTSLGEAPNYPESEEITFSDDDNIEQNIGLKQTSLIAHDGLKILPPMQTSQEIEGMKLKLPSFKAYGEVGIYNYDNKVFYEKALTDSLQISNKLASIKTINPPYLGYGLPWLIDPNTAFYYGQYLDENPLGLKSKTFLYDSTSKNMHEAFVLGLNSPSLESALSTQNDEYADKAYLEMGKAYINKQFTNDGIKYLNVFESPTDFTHLSQSNPIELNFLNKKHVLLGYVDEDSVLIKPGCDPVCGDSFVDEELYEQCDLQNLNNQTCASLGLVGGTLKCYPPKTPKYECTFDTSECTCGNGIIDAGEQCDWPNLDETCNSLGFSGGTLTCNYCQYDTSSCSKCGNGIVEQGEECDDQNLNNFDSCRNDCKIPVCGDGICSDFGTETCYTCQVDCGTCCFLPGTKVTTPSGEKTIENLKVGDKVISFNEKTKTNEPAKIEKTFEHKTSGYLIVNNKLFVTQEHPFLINGEWKTIGQAKLGDNLQTIDGKTETISSIKQVTKQVTVYNIEVSPNNNYYAEGILAHNKVPIDIFPDPDIDNSDDGHPQQTE